MMIDNAFVQRSRKIAESFLQTVVVVDDRPIFPGVSSTEPPTEVIEPTSIFDAVSPLTTTPSYDTEDGGQKTADQADSDSATDEEDNKEEHDINAKSLIDSFAELGLVCGLLAPKKDENNVIHKVSKVAHRADIVILDWYLLKNSSEIALAILENILEEDLSQRLRIIAIYTSQPFLTRMVTEVERRLESTLAKNGRNHKIVKPNAFTLQAGPIRVVVYAKPNSNISKLDKPSYARIVSEDQLPARLVTDFTEMTAGLVSNVALRSLCILRDHTHDLLGKLHQQLDAPFLAHRALLPHPEEASDHLAEIVASEISSLLFATHMGDISDIDATQEWLVAQAKLQRTLTIQRTHAETNKSIKEPYSFTEDEVLDILTHGVEKATKFQAVISQLDKKTKGKFYRTLTELFLAPASAKSAQPLDFEFARLTSLSMSRSKERSVNNPQPPILTLGTVLEKPKSGDEPASYWLCLQPPCDSTRINTKERRFPLLKLRKIDGVQSFRIVVINLAGDNIRLMPLLSAYELDSVMFPVINAKGVILGQIEGSEFYFESVRDDKYFWLGTLKYEQAQRLANEFSTQISRVGLDESEWLRRAAQLSQED